MLVSTGHLGQVGLGRTGYNSVSLEVLGTTLVINSVRSGNLLSLLGLMRGVYSLF